MWAIGRNFTPYSTPKSKKKSEIVLYKHTDSMHKKTNVAHLCQRVRDYMGEYFKDELEQIQNVEISEKIPEELGGEKGVSCAMVISRDLINTRFFPLFFFCFVLFFGFLCIYKFLFLSLPSHFDLDGSVSFNIWSELESGKAKNWYFVLPNVLTKEVYFSIFFFIS